MSVSFSIQKYMHIVDFTDNFCRDEMSELIYVTHLPLDKIAAIFRRDIFKRIFLNKNNRIPIPMSLKLVPRSQQQVSIDTKQATSHYVNQCGDSDAHME